MPELSQLAVFTLTCVLLALTPGPDIIYVIIRGAVQGPKAGLVAACGLAVGVVGHTLFCIVGLTALLAASSVAFTAVKFMGAAYLIYLGARMWMDGDKLDMAADKTTKPLAAIFRQTIVMNLINPKVALFFLAFLPQFVDPLIGPVETQFAIFGFIFMMVALVVMGSAGLAGGQVRRLLERSDKGTQWAHRIAGTLLIGLGLRLAFESQS